MSEEILQIAEDFWNIRGEFRIGGVVNIGTQASLLRRADGSFLMLDAYTLKGEIREQVDALTNGGADIEAIINLHPFHTVHVKKAHEQYPNAKLYGTQRHLDRFPDLPWQPQRSESEECAALFAEDLEFSVPEGVDFISRNENLHFSSVLAYHAGSRTMHVDDTLMYLPLPGPLGKLKQPILSFHPTLAMTMERRSGAAAQFRDWAIGLAERWGDAENLCAAHSAALRGADNEGAPIKDRILKALEKAERILRAHERKHG